MNTKTHVLAALAIVLTVCSSCCGKKSSIEVFPMDQIYVEQPLSQRLERNLSRLQDDIYQPPHVFEDLDWPGDFIGRTILGLTMDSRVLHTHPALLEELIDSLPSKLNEKGYLGPIYDPVINEQTLSGHGWLLRGLCEYSKWTGDERVMPIIKSVAENLFVAGKGRYSGYPISPEERSTKGGEASGSIASETSGWMLSTDIGCMFIGMAGLIDAYEVLPEKEIGETIDEMIARFLEVDLAGINAQTHATLSALRGLIKYAAITGDASLVEVARNRWDLYVSQGMTCTFANYNWFGRPDSWTEPCAIVDSYIVAFELWKLTMDPEYRNMAELICVNAIEHAQRTNGGFGCDSCPSAEDPCLKVVIPEAHWCCTMRGAEGLARIAESGWAVKGDALYIPFFRSGSLCAEGLEVSQKSGYPEEGTAVIVFRTNDKGIKSLCLPQMPWAENYSITLNGESVNATSQDGFLCIDHKFAEGDWVEVSFDQPLRNDTWNGSQRYFKGAIMLGLKTDAPVSGDAVCTDSLATVSHLMGECDPIQVLF